jgi:hypothetical protein
MRLTKGEIERIRVEARALVGDPTGRWASISLNELDALCATALQREQDVADLVDALTSLDIAANGIDNRDRPEDWGALMEASRVANALLARIREQDRK